MADCLHDLRIAARVFRRAPGFAALVVVTLAVGIGGSVAMFSVVDGVLFGELPYREPDRLVMIWNRHEATGARKVQVSGPDFLDYRAVAGVFEDLAYIHNATDNTLTDGQRAEQVDVGYVSANLFRFLGVDPVLGPGFPPGDAAGTAAMTGPGPAIISHGLWVRRYGSDPAILGRVINLSGTPVEVVGVVPQDFRLILPYMQGGTMSSGANDRIDVWRVLPDRGFARMPRAMAVVRVLARLAPGVTVDQARQALDGVAAGQRETHQVHRERGTAIDVVPLHADVVGAMQPMVWSLTGAVAVLLLIACANVATLVSVQAHLRRQDIAVRLALGAKRARVVRHALTEHALLAGAGAVLGIAVAAALIQTIVRIAPSTVPLVRSVTVDARALGCAVVIGMASTLVFGLWPGILAARSHAPAELAIGMRGSIGRGHRFRNLMVAVEVALSVVLVIGGGLLLRSFLNLQASTLGFQPTAVSTAKVALGAGVYEATAPRRRYWETLTREVAGIPGATQVGLVWPLPFTGQGVESPYDTAGDAPSWGRYLAYTASTMPGYFEAMGAEVIAGRTFDARDLDRADQLAVIDDQAAERLYPGGRALGQPIWVEESGKRRPLEIIGVVTHLRHTRMTGPERDVIYRLSPGARTMALVVRSSSEPATVVPHLRRITAALDPNVPLFDERTLASYLADQMAPTRFTMTLAAAFGIAALLMAVVGLYGVVSFAVTQRAAELGVRMALGADHASIIRLVMRSNGTLVAAGIGAGLVMAVGMSRGIESLLVNVSSVDPLSFVAAAGLIAISASLAAYVPARRAARVDPAATLRSA